MNFEVGVAAGCDKIFEMSEEIGFNAKLGLLSGLREQELVYIEEKAISNDGYGCNCEKLHVVNCKDGMMIIATGWTRENKKALATIRPIKYWDKLRIIRNFDYNYNSRVEVLPIDIIPAFTLGSL
jgi:hypothetical protein